MQTKPRPSRRPRSRTGEARPAGAGSVAPEAAPVTCSSPGARRAADTNVDDDEYEVSNDGDDNDHHDDHDHDDGDADDHGD